MGHRRQQAQQNPSTEACPAEEVAMPTTTALLNESAIPAARETLVEQPAAQQRDQHRPGT
jgi:hypothetical protein